MPIPRYEGGATPFQQVDPTAAKASAQMFSTLSQRLDSWGDTLYEQGKVQVAQEGRQQAIKDITSGDPLKIEKGYGFYAKAYNDVSKTIFNAKIEGDLKSYATDAATRSSNPQQFEADFGAYAKTTITKLDEPEFQAIATAKAYDLMGINKAVVTKRYIDDQNKQLKESTTELEKLNSDTYARYFREGNTEKAGEILAQMGVVYDKNIDRGLMLKESREAKLNEFVKNAYKISETLDLEEAIRTKKGTSTLLEIVNKDRSNMLTTEENNELRKSLSAKLKDRVNMFEDAQKADEQTDQTLAVATKRIIRSDLIAGTATQAQLNEAYENNKISYKEFQEYGDILASGPNRFGSEAEVANLMPKALAGTLSSSEILSNPKLNRQQQIQIMKTNQSQKDENTRQAIERQKAGQVTTKDEHISLIDQQRKNIGFSFPLNSTSKTIRGMNQKAVNKLNLLLNDYTKEATEKGYSSDWIYRQMDDAILKEQDSVSKEIEKMSAPSQKKEEEKKSGWFGDSTGYKNFMDSINQTEERNV